MTKKQQRSEFSELRDKSKQNSARIIQRAWKKYTIKKQRIQQSALIKSRCDCTLCYFNKLCKTHRLFVLNLSASHIQALWLGYFTRKTLMKSREFRLLYRRVVTANSKASNELKLGNRLDSALAKLHRNRNVNIDNELSTIEVVTRMSPECCLKAAQKSVVPIMMNILNDSNRSEAHKMRVFYSISILVNISKYEKCSKYLSGGESISGMCIKMMKIHKKTENILLKCITLLAILVQNRHTREIITKDTMNRFTIGCIVNSLNAIDSKCTVEGKTWKELCPKFVPYWCLKKASLQQFTDKLHAIKFLAHLFGNF